MRRILEFLAGFSGLWVLSEVSSKRWQRICHLSASLAATDRTNAALQNALTSRCAEAMTLQETAKRALNRLDRKQDECDSLIRQRDTALEMLDRVKWDARVATAKNMVVAAGLQEAAPVRG